MARRRRRRKSGSGVGPGPGREVSEAELLELPAHCACRLFFLALSLPIRRVTRPTACGQCCEGDAQQPSSGQTAKPRF